MKRIYFIVFLFIISVLSFNCQKEFSAPGFGAGTSENNLSAPVIATLQGNISDENGQPAEGVQIKVGSKIATTNVNGYFRIINAALDKNASLVTAVKPGYFTAYRTFNATSAVNQVVIKLIKKTLAGSVSATTGGEISLSNGTKVSLPVNGIVKEADGSLYTGSINVYAAYIDPTAKDINETIPGSFMANDKDNKRVVLKSFGMMAVVLESTSGEKLQIAKGSTAKLTIPIPSSTQSSAPATISSWYVDEQTGLWKEEGTASKNGTNYVGDVKHFSFWNSDFADPAITLSLTVKSTKGQPIVYASIQVEGTGIGVAHGYSDSIGQVSGLVPANENLVLKVYDECYQVIYSQNIGPFAENTNLGDITIGNSTSSIVTVEGKLLNCSNTPVINGYAIIYFDNTVRYAGVNSSGDFSTTLITCSGNAATCEILGVDDLAQQQGSVINATTTSPITNAGNISACGTSALEFIKYKLDGTDYTLSKNSPMDSLIALTNYWPPLFITSVMGYSSSSDINFSFINNAAPGVFAMSNLFVMNLNNTGLIQPFNVNLTSYPQNTGEFYEGNFTGQFRDSLNLAPLHNISCSFRLRKY